LPVWIDIEEEVF
jgi:hypothetical protein